MTRRQLLFLSALVLVSSFIGGFVASRLFNPSNAWAQGSLSNILANNVFAKSIALRDSDGNIRMMLSGEPFPGITFLDRANRQRLNIDLNLFSDEPSIVLYDHSSVPRIIFGLNINDEPDMTFYRSDEQVAVTVQVTDKGMAGISCWDGLPHIRAFFGIAALENEPSLHLIDKTGNSAVYIGSNLVLSNDGSKIITPVPSIYLVDKERNILFKAP